MILKKPILFVAVLIGFWLGTKYLLPIALPFLLGAAVAVAAEPVVRPVSRRLPRAAAAGLGVSLTLLGTAAILWLAGAVAVKELTRLMQVVPKLGNTAQQGITLLRTWAEDVSRQAPAGIRPALEKTVSTVFDDGTVLVQQATQRIPQVITATLGYVGNGLISVGTGVIAAFLISSRLPKIKKAVTKRLPASWYETWLPALKRVKHALGGWLKAQCKLSGITWVIVTVGFVVLKIPYAPAWALLVAVVDAVPILGTGTVLAPWALISLLQGNHLQTIGLLCTYGAALMMRTVLEPKLVGRHLGLDSLATLICLYAGYRVWGILGMLLTPILAAAAKSVITPEPA